MLVTFGRSTQIRNANFHIECLIHSRDKKRAVSITRTPWKEDRNKKIGKKCGTCMHSNGAQSTIAMPRALTDSPGRRMDTWIQTSTRRGCRTWTSRFMNPRQLPVGKITVVSFEIPVGYRRNCRSRTDREALDIVNIILCCLYRAAVHGVEWSGLGGEDTRRNGVVCYS